MRSPSLVARLMGLEAMPASAPQDKPRKTVDSLNCHEGLPSSCSSRHDLDLDLEVAGAGHGKQDSRPQKLQKTGFFDRRPADEAAARAGSEVLQLNRIVWSRGRKQHHKLASAVKSPRLLGRKNSTRLMGAAVRILEPGLQRRSQARCALTYGSPSQRSAGGMSSPEKPGEQAKKYVSPCRNCGASLMEVTDRNSRFEQPLPLVGDRKPHVLNLPKSSASSLEVLNMNRVKLPFYSSEESRFRAPQSDSIAENRDLSDRKERSQYIRDQCNSNADNFRARNSHYYSEKKPHSSSFQAAGNAEKKLLADRKQHTPYEQDQRNSCLVNSMPTRSTQRKTGARHTQIASMRNKTTGPSSCSKQQSRREPGSATGSRDSIVQNRSFKARAKVFPGPVISSKTETNQQKNLVQRRTPLKSNTQTRGTGGPKSTPPKNRTTHALVTEARFVNSRSRKQENTTNGTGIKGTEVVSCTFNLPHRQNSESDSSAIISSITKTTFVKDEHTSASFPTKMVTDLREETSQKLDTVRGDELSALLEQKIKELNFLEQDESLSDVGSKSGRSTATILQELISAFTDGGICDTSSQYGYTAKKKQEEEAGESSVLSSLGFECDQPSPISILEASFLTDSCLSESLNSMSGQVLNFGTTAESCGKSQESWDAEADFSDSATSSNVGEMEIDELSCSLDAISFMYNSNCQFGRPRSRPSYIGALVSYLELLFEEHFAKGDKDAHESWVNTLLLGTLEMLCDACQTKSWFSSSFPETKGKAHLKGFLCDCMIEHLDSNYSKSMITTWKKPPCSSLSSKNLAEDVDRDIARWRELASMNLDDMIEQEIRCLPVQWIDFKSEACESGEEIQQDILQALVDEAVIEFLPCW